eukprot:scpid84036/ scgid23472/ Glycerophosphodiester phosphodiesterase domain-containing protein 1; Glycerophosphodiester phosphodiesterase 4
MSKLWLQSVTRSFRGQWMVICRASRKAAGRNTGSSSSIARKILQQVINDIRGRRLSVENVRIRSTSASPRQVKAGYKMTLSTGDIVGVAIGSTIGVYALTSVLLYMCPCLLHRKVPHLFDGYLIAHRGGAGEYLENTMGAFRHAVLNTKADILELDLHLTKDKQIVICHDSDLKRSTGYEGTVEEMNYADLPPLNQYLEITFDPGRVCERVCEDTKIALFEDLLHEFPNTVLNIDLKSGSQELVEKTAEMLQRYNRTRSVIWGSSKNDVLEMCYKQDPSIPVYFSAGRVMKLGLYFWSGALAFMPLREHVFEVPYSTPELRARFHQLPGYIRLLVTVAQALLVNRFVIGYLQKRGIETYVFVVNDEDSWRKVYDLGVTGVHTDYPTKLRQFLDANPQYTTRKQAVGEPGEKESLVGTRSDL